MSRYDRQRERKRFLIIAAVVVTFAGALYLWGSYANQGFSSIDRITTQSGQD